MQASSPNSVLKLLNGVRYSLNMSLAKQPGLLNNITRVCILSLDNLNMFSYQTDIDLFKSTTERSH